MLIRYATPADIEPIMAIYAQARLFMQQQGNPHQWVNGYPSQEVVLNDIALQRLYLCLDEAGEIVAQFCYFVGDDPTYHHIDGGEWLDAEPYGVVHRIASSGKVSGVGAYCLAWCFDQHPNMRIDTHHDNHVMQQLLLRTGYQLCGTIICASGTPRLAYHRNR